MFNFKLKTLFNIENKNTTISSNNQSKVLDTKLIELLSSIEKDIDNFQLDIFSDDYDILHKSISVSDLENKILTFIGVFSFSFYFFLYLYSLFLDLFIFQYKSIILAILSVFSTIITTMLIYLTNNYKIHNYDLLIEKSFSVLMKINEQFDLSKNTDFQYVFKINYDYLHNKKILSNNNKKNIFKENLNFIQNYFINKNDNGENLKNIIDNYKG